MRLNLPRPLSPQRSQLYRVRLLTLIPISFFTPATVSNSRPALSIIPAGRIWRPRNVLQYLPWRARQLGSGRRDKECLVARQPPQSTAFVSVIGAIAATLTNNRRGSFLTQSDISAASFAVVHNDPALPPPSSRPSNSLYFVLPRGDFLPTTLLGWPRAGRAFSFHSGACSR
jgi:hypothetical protein